MGNYQCSKQRVHMVIDKLTQFNTPTSLNMYKRSVSPLLKYAPVKQLLNLCYRPLKPKMNPPAIHFSNYIISLWMFKENVSRSSTIHPMWQSLFCYSVRPVLTAWVSEGPDSLNPSNLSDSCWTSCA